ncbi:MAG: GNAT family N-acetyltransferase [Microthrixaceae bacterium]
MPPADESPRTRPEPDRRAGSLRWVSPLTGESDTVMAAAGLERVRTLDQLRLALPAGGIDERRAGAGLAVRPLRRGHDEAGVVRVNNRAFRWHPDQAGWTVERLAAVLDEEWVDLEGVLVHDGPDGAIDGFCWTRVHPATATEPARGEIFLIAADPDRHGTGLGRALVLAGLDHLAGAGVQIALLYVESDNEPAQRLYRRLGFARHHSDGGYAQSPGGTAEP